MKSIYKKSVTFLYTNKKECRKTIPFKKLQKDQIPKNKHKKEREKPLQGTVHNTEERNQRKLQKRKGTPQAQGLRYST
jgi:hypothetical protein